MSDDESRTRPKLWLAIRRALLGRCPNCGRGRLFASFLKPVERCAACGEAYGQIRTDDAASWLTILVVGHIAVPIVLVAERHTDWPMWVSITVWCSFAALLSLAVLPRAKAFLLSMIWLYRADGVQ